MTLDLSSLNPNQLKACLLDKGAALLVAVAGSGKTKTLTHRVAYLIQEKQVNPSNIVLVTFTNKAANEMIHRVAAMVGPEIASRVNAGTFHSYAIKQLHKYCSNSSAYTVLDSADSASALQLCMSDMDLSAEFSATLKKADTILNVISYAKNTLQSITEVLTATPCRFDTKITPFYPELERIALEYARYKEKNNFLDFDDILLKLIHLLESDLSAYEKISGSCEYLMVDEYQDTNALQSKLCKLLAGTHKNIMAVGDEAQSIYSFRGADFNNIMSFADQWENCEIIVLDYNYRSTQPILDIANQTLSKMTEKYDKTLKAFTAENKSASQLPLCVTVSSQAEQAKYIVSKIKRNRQEGIPLKDQAALIKFNFHGVLLENELLKNKIPYVKYGGLRFAETSHVKDFLALVRLIKNIFDELAFYRLFNLIPGVGPKSIKSIYSKLKAKESAVSLLDALDLVKITPKSTGALHFLKEAIVKSKGLKCDALCTSIYPAVEHLIKSNYDVLEHEDRLKDIGVLIEIAQDYTSITEFLNDFSLDNSSIAGAASKENSFVLSTIHSAKGLEFNSVFVVNCTEDVYSARTSNEEQHRLFYVLVTRAKQDLEFVCPRENFKREYTPVSSYLKGCRLAKWPV